ncbi:MAG: hypothetical protein NTZ67_01395 [Gammaproteobacteria bacterium]|nr:hypothetical protein [Gammaproteobacteria bacterium]
MRLEDKIAQLRKAQIEDLVILEFNNPETFPILRRSLYQFLLKNPSHENADLMHEITLEITTRFPLNAVNDDNADAFDDLLSAEPIDPKNKNSFIAASTGFLYGPNGSYIALRQYIDNKKSATKLAMSDGCDFCDQDIPALKAFLQANLNMIDKEPDPDYSAITEIANQIKNLLENNMMDFLSIIRTRYQNHILDILNEMQTLASNPLEFNIGNETEIMAYLSTLNQYYAQSEFVIALTEMINKLLILIKEAGQQTRQSPEMVIETLTTLKELTVAKNNNYAFFQAPSAVLSTELENRLTALQLKINSYENKDKDKKEAAILLADLLSSRTPQALAESLNLITECCSSVPSGTGIFRKHFFGKSDLRLLYEASRDLLLEITHSIPGLNAASSSPRRE